MVTRPSAMVIASRPTMTGSMAATSAPNATTSTTSVSGSTRPVHDDGDIVRERTGEGLLEEVGGARGLGGLARAAAQGEHLLYVASPRGEQQRERRPRRDDPPAPADEGARG